MSNDYKTGYKKGIQAGLEIASQILLEYLSKKEQADCSTIIEQGDR